MPIATPEQYITMLETAKKEGYAYPAVNVTTIEVINGALRAFPKPKATVSSRFPSVAANSPPAAP